MHYWPVILVVGSRRALAAAFILTTVALMSLLWATPLQGEAITVAGDGTGEPVAGREWQPRELSPEWRWSPEPVQFEHMVRQRLDRAPHGSFDRVLDMAGR